MMLTTHASTFSDCVHLHERMRWRCPHLNCEGKETSQPQCTDKKNCMGITIVHFTTLNRQCQIDTFICFKRGTVRDTWPLKVRNAWSLGWNTRWQGREHKRDEHTCTDWFPIITDYLANPIWWGFKFGPWESVLPGFLPSFPSQIWVNDVTFVTFFGDKKCDASHLSHFWAECDALAHNFFLLTCDVFCHILSENRHILAPPVQNFFEREEMWLFGWDWNKFLSSRLRFVTYLGSVKREGHLG